MKKIQQTLNFIFKFVSCRGEDDCQWCTIGYNFKIFLRHLKNLNSASLICHQNSPFGIASYMTTYIHYTLYLYINVITHLYGFERLDNSIIWISRYIFINIINFRYIWDIWWLPKNFLVIYYMKKILIKVRHKNHKNKLYIIQPIYLYMNID